MADWRAGAFALSRAQPGDRDRPSLLRMIWIGMGDEESAQKPASGEGAGALLTDALCHNKAMQTRHGRSNATNE